MFKNGRLLGKFNILDCIIALVILILIIGVLIVKNNIFNPVKKVSKGKKTVEFVVTTKAYDVTAEKEIFEIGDKTFLTIRNVPYTELKIVNVKKEYMKEMFFNYDRPEMPYLIENRAYPNRVQYEITLQDKAQITKDGAVIGGNKIKIGLPVDIEGFNYRFSGSVSDVKIINNEKE